METNSEAKKPVDKRMIVWIMNIVVAVLCLLSILCYFFGSVWQINLTYTLTADQLADLMKDTDLGFDAHDIIGEEGERVEISVALTAGHVFGSLTSAEQTVDNIIDSNVDNVVKQLSGTMNVMARKAVKSVAKNVVKDEVKNNIRKYLSKDGSEVSEEEVNSKLDKLGFSDEYISDKTDKLVDDVFEGGQDVEAITGNIMETVDDMYKDFRTNSAGQDGLEDFNDVELGEEDRAEIENTVRETVEKLADENGSINPDDLIAELLAQALSDASKDDGGEAEANGIVLLADEASTTDSASGQEKLASAISDMLNDFISEDIRGIAVYVFYGMAGLMFLSMIPWLYVLIKIVVKFAKKDPNPTVKLAVPIWLGWLFFLILVAIPSIALWIVQMPSMAGTLASISFLSGIVGMLEQMSFSISSLTCISAICALIAFGISIYYMIVRKQLKKEGSGGNTSQGEPEELHEEVATSEE